MSVCLWPQQLEVEVQVLVQVQVEVQVQELELRLQALSSPRRAPCVAGVLLQLPCVLRRDHHTGASRSGRCCRLRAPQASCSLEVRRQEGLVLVEAARCKTDSFHSEYSTS